MTTKKLLVSFFERLKIFRTFWSTTKRFARVKGAEPARIVAQLDVKLILKAEAIFSGQ